MANNKGHFYKRFIDDTIELFAEWTATPDVVTNTAIISVTLYYDASKRGVLNSPTIDGNKAFAYATIDGQRYNFDVPTMSGSKKHLVGTITSKPVKLNDEAITPFEISCYLDFGEMERFYESLLSTDYKAIRSVSANSGTEYVGKVMRTSYLESITGEKVLGVAHSYTINKPDEEFTHKIEYFCGEKSGLICEPTPDIVVPVALPKDLALESTDKSTFKVTIKVTTYLSGVKLKESTTEELYEVSADCHPTCSISVVDGEDLTEKYGGFVQGNSRFVITTTPSLAYTSPIEVYSVLANGEELDKEVSTSAVIRNAGAQTIKATVTDARGRTSPEATATIDVIPWEKPRVTDLRAFRCDENGEPNSLGGYMKVTFDAEISPVNNKNSAKYVISYQQTSGIGSGIKEITDYGGQYSVEGGTYIFEAEKNAYYAISITAYDDFGEDTRSKGGATAVVLMNLLASGLGLCFGNIATLDGVCEIAFKTYPSGGFIYPKLKTGDSLFGLRTPNIYYCESPQDIGGMPSDEDIEINDPFVVEVLPLDSDGDEIIQRLTTFPTNNTNPKVLIRALRQSSWSKWHVIYS